jgi:hypothetical protein
MRLLHEPLVHFFLLGAALFVLYESRHERGARTEETVTVSTAQIALFREQWSRQSGRPPTSQELQALIDQHIREEVLYREAKALGLDRDDMIVRRRLVQKMDFLAADVAALIAPSEEELRTFFTTHAEQYQEPVKLSFTHIYFNPDNRHDQVRREAKRVLTELHAEKPTPQRAPERGDRFMLSYDYTRRSQAEIAREFGRTFAAQLFTLAPGQWWGPIESGYGVHVVRIQERVDAAPPDFDAVHDRVKEDVLAGQRREANEAAYQHLRERYTIVIAPEQGAEP